MKRSWTILFFAIAFAGLPPQAAGNPRPEVSNPASCPEGMTGIPITGSTQYRCVPNDEVSLGDAPAMPTQSTTGNRAETWTATKINDKLFEDQTTAGYTHTNAQGVTTAAIGQNEAFTANANVMTKCVETNLNGRTDQACAATPTNPECVGMRQATQSATTCEEYLDASRPEAGCRRYGSGGYTMEEWLAFSGQYYAGIANCFDTKSRNDLKNNRIVALTEGVKTGTTDPTPSGANEISSGISGTTGASRSPGTESASLELEEDGSEFFGLEKGELLRRAKTGASFYEVVKDSPFAEKLNAGLKEKLDYGLTESSLVADRVRVRQELEKLGEKVTEKAIEERLAEGPATPLAPAAEIIPASSVAAPVPAPVAAAIPTTQSVAASVAPLARAEPAASERALTLAERIDAVAAAARARQAAVRAGRSPSSVPIPLVTPLVQAAPATNLLDTSLFQRIRQLYQRRGATFRPPATDSQGAATESGRALKSLAEPAFFQSL